MPLTITESFRDNVLSLGLGGWTAKRVFVATGLRGLRQCLPRRGQELQGFGRLTVRRRRIDRERSKRGLVFVDVYYASATHA